MLLQRFSANCFAISVVILFPSGRLLVWNRTTVHVHLPNEWAMQGFLRLGACMVSCILFTWPSSYLRCLSWQNGMVADSQSYPWMSHCRLFFIGEESTSHPVQLWHPDERSWFNDFARKRSEKNLSFDKAAKMGGIPWLKLEPTIHAVYIMMQFWYQLRWYGCTMTLPKTALHLFPALDNQLTA